jgi:cholesterol transport system auxiliary component
VTRVLIFLGSIVLAGCGGGGAAPAARTFDLGIQGPNPAIPAVRIAAVRAAAPFDGLEMHYRLAWRDSAEIAAYAHSRWAAPPAELLRRQLLRAAGEGTAKCSLRVELHDFSQVFSRKDASDARIELRAELSAHGAALAQQGFTVAQPAGPDASSGARALAEASARAIHDLGDWIAKQAPCKS